MAHLTRACRHSLRKRVAFRTVAAPAWKLYWCTTEDHDEDWFVVARSNREARRFHEDVEGYGPGDADAVLVMRFPAELQAAAAAEAGWPSLKFLRECGGEILRSESPRVVRFGERVFSEGMLDHELMELEDDRAEARGDGRPHGTQRRHRRPS